MSKTTKAAIHPQAYIEHLRDTQEILAQLEQSIKAIKEQAEQFPCPDGLRPATEADIVTDQILWYPDSDGTWCVVETVLKPNDQFKAFEFDGSRYGLDGAFVETERHIYEPVPPRFASWHEACLATNFGASCVYQGKKDNKKRDG